MDKNHDLYTTPFGNGAGTLPVEAIRYRLILSDSVPQAQTQWIVLKLLGLDAVITIGKVNPVSLEAGWDFSQNVGGQDSILKISTLAEAYPQGETNVSVPAVIDLRNGRVVNNDFHRLSIQWETVWKPFHKHDAPELYPETRRADIDKTNAELDALAEAIDCAGHATTQADYETQYDRVFADLDELEEQLSSQRYLHGDDLTDSDIRLYTLLVRFDTAYHFVYRLNRNRLVEFPNLWNYAKDLYERDAFRDTTDFAAIRRAYFLSKKNPYGIVSEGPQENIWSEPHDRARFAAEGRELHAGK